MRKTIKIEDVVALTNEFLKNSTTTADERRGAAFMLETFLHATGNYRGYRHLLESEVPAGELPGVNYEVNNRGMFVPCENYEQRFFNTDSTRIAYYV